MLIPVLSLRAWSVIKERLRAPCLSYSKRMETITIKSLPRITGMIRYSPTKPGCFCYSLPTHDKLNPLNTNMCLSCYNEDLRLDSQQGVIICSSCGLICEENVHDQSSYVQSYAPLASNTRQKQQIPRRHSESPYKRMNHFKDIILRLQGKECVKITSAELDHIRAEITKRGIDAEDLRSDTMKVILRFLGYQKYYNHCYYIIKEITGTPLVTFTDTQTKILVSMFIRIQKPYSLYSNRRANMMSYQYIIKKFCEILEWEEVFQSLDYLKSREKTTQQDQIWKKICKDVGFIFKPSLL